MTSESDGDNDEEEDGEQDEDEDVESGSESEGSEVQEEEGHGIDEEARIGPGLRWGSTGSRGTARRRPSSVRHLSNCAFQYYIADMECYLAAQSSPPCPSSNAANPTASLSYVWHQWIQRGCRTCCFIRFCTSRRCERKCNRCTCSSNRPQSYLTLASRGRWTEPCNGERRWQYCLHHTAHPAAQQAPSD